MLKLRNERRVVPRISVPRTEIYLSYAGYMKLPWTKNFANGNDQGKDPKFGNMDFNMYTFTFPTSLQLSYEYTFTGDNIVINYPITCYVYSSNDLKTPRSTTKNANTLHGLPESNETDRMNYYKYLSPDSRSIEIPVGYWGSHDPTCKLSFEMKVLDTNGLFVYFVSPQFSAVTSI
jgi:hypothetical protein